MSSSWKYDEFKNSLLGDPTSHSRCERDIFSHTTESLLFWMWTQVWLTRKLFNMWRKILFLPLKILPLSFSWCWKKSLNLYTLLDYLSPFVLQKINEMENSFTHEIYANHSFHIFLKSHFSISTKQNTSWVWREREREFSWGRLYGFSFSLWMGKQNWDDKFYWFD